MLEVKPDNRRNNNKKKNRITIEKEKIMKRF